MIDKKWCVEVIYRDGGINYNKDRKIEAIAGRRAEGSGFGWGQRDLCFYYAREAYANKLMRKLRAHVSRVTIRVYDTELDIDYTPVGGRSLVKGLDTL